MNKENLPKRIRFTPDDDLALLREVVNVNPLKDMEKWKEVRDIIQAITGKSFTIRSLKDHLHLLLEIWKKKDATNVGKSGIEEMYSERDTLLQEIRDICRELNTSVKQRKAKAVSRNDKIIILGKEHRASTSAAFYNEPAYDDSFVVEDVEKDNIFEASIHDYCIEETVAEISSVTQTPSSNNLKANETPAALKKKENSEPTWDVAKPNKQKRPKLKTVRKDALHFVEDRHANEQAMKKRQLDLEERKLNLEERRMELEEERFKLEKEERIYKMTLEQANNNNQQSLIEKQNKMLDILINKLNS